MPHIHVLQRHLMTMLKNNIIPKVESYGARYERVDVVFGVYKKSSLKSETRSKRGQGIRRKKSDRNE